MSWIPAKNWRSPTLFEGRVTLSLSLPPEAEVDDVLTYEAQVTDPSRVEPFVNRFTLAVKAEREAQLPTTKAAGAEAGQAGLRNRQGLAGRHKLAVPNPVEIWEKDWGAQNPIFDKFTAMRIKRPPGAEENSVVFDYLINMNNVFIDQAEKRSRDGSTKFATATNLE